MAYVVLRRPRRGRGCQTVGLIVAAAALLGMTAGEASAQGTFESLFGVFRRPAYAAPQPTAAYAPQQSWGSPSLAAPAPPPPATLGPSATFCVRLCDGRFFPLQGHAGISAAQACKSFCPAARTRIFFGSSIERAAAADGSRYADLDHAFLYRDRLVADCTCNGRDSFGLAPVDVASDPTLRPGDIVAGTQGLLAFRGARRGRSQAAEFTPIDDYPGFAPELRRQLSALKVGPATAPATLPQEPAGERRAELTR